MQDKERRLQENVRVCKADMLDYYNRARNICAHNLDEDNEETVKMTKLVANLATKFAKEESARTGHNILSFRGEEASDPVSPTENDAIKQVCMCVPLVCV